jgi:predicted metal-dependent hydrolase
MAERDVTTVTGHYHEGIALAVRGAWFEAHESFEAAWRSCDAEERDFFQGLVHVVVSAFQRGRGKPVAAESQRLKALRRLQAFAPRHRDLDVGAIIEALERSEPDLRKHLIEAVAQPGVAVEEEQQTERDERRT